MGKGNRQRAAGQKNRVGPYVKIPRKRERVLDDLAQARRLGSDTKQKNVLGKCAICRQESILLLGHVFPKWSLRWMRWEGGIVSWLADREGSTSSQDGNKHYLLCEMCEQLLGRSENRLRTITCGTPLELNSADVRITQQGPYEFRLDEDEQNPIGKALLGIALKAHYAPSLSHSIYSERIVNKITASIRKEDVRGYHFFAAKWYGLEVGNPRAYCGVSFVRIEGSLFAYIGLAGIDWFILLDGDVPDEIRPEKNWSIELCPTRGRASWFDNWEDELDDLIPCGLEGFSCPCGSKRMYEECCRDTWYRGFEDEEVDFSGKPVVAINWH